MDSYYDSEHKKTVKKIFRSFGRYEAFAKDHPDELKRLEEQYGNHKDKYAAKKENLIQDFFDNSRAENSNFYKYRHFFLQNLSYLYLRRLWNSDLCMDRMFSHLSENSNNSKIEFNPSIISLYYCVLKIISPCSHLFGIKESVRFLNDPMRDVSLDDVYRCLRYLSDHKDSIMHHINKRIQYISPRKHSLLFYDCTNCYFETSYNDEYWNRKKAKRALKKIIKKENLYNFNDCSDDYIDNFLETDELCKSLLDNLLESYGQPLRMYGVSKEKRFDLPLVTIALIIDDNAIPVDFNVFSGNQAEQKTMLKSIRKLKKKYKIDNAIIVADSALNSTENLCMLVKEGMGFSVAKSALSFENKIRNNELKIEDFSEIQDEAGNKTSLLYKIIPYKKVSYTKKDDGSSIRNVIECNLMITFSKKRYNRDIACLNSQVERAQAAVENKEKIKIARSGWKQLIDIDSSKEKQDDKLYGVAKSIKNDIIEKRRICAGFSGILFKSPQGSEELKPSYISSIYHHLVKIEECFRIMKHEIEIRPMYVRHPDSIKGHILICVIALIMIRIIQRKLSAKNISITSEQIGLALNDVKVSAIKNNTDDYIFINTTEIPISKTEDRSYNNEVKNYLEVVLDALGFKPLNNAYYCLGELREYFGARSISVSEYQEFYIGSKSNAKIEL